MANGNRIADPATQLEVDQAILDYLLFSANKALLWDHRHSGRHDSHEHRESENAVQMADSFLVMFKIMHPGHHGDVDLEFRLRLLKFTVLFAKRNVASSIRPLRNLRLFRNIRLKRQGQVKTFTFQEDDSGSEDIPDLTEYLAPEDVMHIQHKSQDFAPLISLMDTLPMFMSLSAAASSMHESTITDDWMTLAAGYMAQAVAEQYLVYKSPRSKVLREAFAWGFDAECAAEEGTDEWMINVMFLGEDEKVAGWEQIRDEHMHHLRPAAGNDLHSHLRSLTANELSIEIFEERIVAFLFGLLDSQTKPILAQVESGRIDGLSEEAQLMKERLGITDETPSA